MFVQLTPLQRDALVQLVDEALEELGPEIHHTMTRDYKDDLKTQRRDLRTLRDLLASADVSRAAPATTPSDPLGMA
jgi:hypothetical protein